MSHTILVVDDETAIRKMLNVGLKSYGYKIITATNGIEAIALASGQKPDLMILDVNLGSFPDGVEVCYRIRQLSAVPIIMLSVAQEKDTKIAALDAGADDYLNKPFFMEELEARIRAILRRSAIAAAENVEDEIHVQDLTIDLLTHRVFLKREEVRLTKSEFRLLSYLATNHGKALTHTMIRQELWGEEKTESFLRVFVNTLRKKIGPEFIETVIGVGYRFVDIPKAE
jgi:two-component system, OmpR family, KDP operon response regulator KdpE